MAEIVLTFAGIFVTVLIAVIGWMGTALWGIRGDLREFITRPECAKKMDDHCSEITELRNMTKKNQEKIAKLEMIAQTEHKVKI